MEPATLRVALAQLLPEPGNPPRNADIARDACSVAAAGKADLVVFPEMWQTGYMAPPEDEAGRRAWSDCAIARDDAWLSAFRGLAADLRIAIVMTYLERWGKHLCNSLTLFASDGSEVLSYRKVHTCPFTWERLLLPGDELPVATLVTAKGPVLTGAMICYDREFPETARSLMLAGAELVVIPNACGLETDRIGQIRTRAFENMMAIATANYPAPQENGHSCIFDGAAALGPGPGDSPRDHLVVESGSVPGLVFGDIDLQLLRHVRSHQIWGNAYRRPEMYQSLCEPISKEPRVDDADMASAGPPHRQDVEEPSVARVTSADDGREISDKRQAG